MNRNREVLDKESANSLSFGSFVAVFQGSGLKSIF